MRNNEPFIFFLYGPDLVVTCFAGCGTKRGPNSAASIERRDAPRLCRSDSGWVTTTRAS